MAAASHNKMLSAALTFTLSFCRLYMTKKTSALPLNAKKHPPLSFKKQRVLNMVKNNSLGRKGRKYQLQIELIIFSASNGSPK